MIPILSLQILRVSCNTTQKTTTSQTALALLPRIKSQHRSMANSRVDLVVVVALVFLGCLLSAGYCTIQGTILSKTLLRETPGAGQVVMTTLYPRNVVEVLCRKSDAPVFDDPWWLQVIFVCTPTGTTYTGWVADYYVNCGNVGNCQVPLCS